MSAVTSYSALPIGLRCLPAGPASRPPNFPRTPRRSHRPGRGVPPRCRAQPGRPSGVAEPATSPEERTVAPRPAREDPPSPWAGWGPGFGGLAGGALQTPGVWQLERKPVTGSGLRWETRWLCELKEVGGAAAFGLASCCKIKALRAKTNTYIKTPVRGEEPVFIVTGRKEDVEMAKREILSAAEHFSMIRATRNKVNGLTGAMQGPPNLPGQTTIQVRVPYRVVGLVVGPKGATIKRIQQQTHTYIVTPSRDKEPVFEVTGMPENVDRAREEIEAHITMRTGSFIDVNADNDFHSNGTDVCLDLQGSTASLWAKAPHPARRPSAALRNDSLSSLGSASTESYYSGRVADASPTSPYSTSSGFTFSEPPAPLGSEECDFGFDFLALDLTTPTTIWSPFERSGNPLQAFSSCSSINGSQRRNSGTATPRHSPTLPESGGVALDHPLARRIQSDPVSTLSWLPTQGSLSSFSNSTGYSSSSSLPGSISATSGSPTDSSSSDGHRKSSRECMVCFESEVIAALVPCGHNLFCMECAMRICGKAEPECPACHTPATQAIHIFS
ncbi:RNA-binding protein MEX3D isoform 2-T2 [Theristicus caerulescens]